MVSLIQKQSRFILIAALSVFVLALMLHRLTLGVDFSDESYHIATAYHFFLGAKAFVDELYIIQSFAFVTSPLFSLLIGTDPSLDGIVIKMRLVFLAFQFLVSCALFFAVRQRFSVTTSFLACVFFFVYVPMNLFSLFYVTLGVGFLSLGMVFCFLANSNTRPAWLLSLAGASLALASCSHPVMFLPSGYLFGSVLWRCCKKPRYYFYPLILMIIFFLLVGTAIFLKYQFSVGDYLNSFKGFRPVLWNFQRVISSLTTLTVPGPLTPLLFLLAGFLALTKPQVDGNKSYLEMFFAIVFPIVIFFHCRSSQGGLGPCGYVMLIFYFSPFLCRHSSPDLTRSFFLAFWVPAMLTSLGLSFASFSGPSSTSAGFLPALPLGIAFLLQISSGKKLPNPRFIFSNVHGLVFLFLMIIFLRGLYGSAFQEAELSDLHYKVRSGPFRGLQTTSVKQQFIEELQETLHTYLPTEGKIVFSCFFPAGYLLTRLIPNHTFLYTVPTLSTIPESTEVVVRLYDETYTRLGIWPQQCEPLTETISSSKGILIKKEGYEIWVRNNVKK